MGLSSPSPYNYSLCHGIYQFETSQNTTYVVNFVFRNGYFPENEFLEDNVYLISFHTSSRSRKFDQRIELTLVNIITEFFSRNPESGLIFLCDISNNLQRPRKITFNKWFKKHNTWFEKHDFKIPGGDHEYLASLIVHQENPYKRIMLKECNKFVSEVSK